jgi:Holliday junction resolvasome RuvABC endonuclease subunit
MRIAGIDPDTKAIQIVALGDCVPNICRIEGYGRRAEDRIQALAARLEVQSLSIWHHVCWVYIETPVMGVNAKALRDQAQVVGIVRSFLWRHGLANSLVDNGTWKKGLLGNGHASKEEIAAFAQTFLQMPPGQPQDAYDAAGIAAWGHNNVPKGENHD